MTDKPKVSIKFLYSYCKDVDAVRHFYTDIIGMDEQAYMNTEEWGWLNYECGGLEYMFFRSDETASAPDGFAAQPGGAGGKLPIPSWTIVLEEEAFAGAVKKLQDEKVNAQQEKPLWLQDSYWGWAVHDPAGNTLELSTVPKQRPASTEWPA